jgi:beta-glucosidase-like glycosyl hydrolase
MNAVPRLGVHAANFWDEATHGVAPRGNVYTTMFPMPSLSGCAFNRSLWQAIGDVAGAEGRAASNLGAANDVFWAPNVRAGRVRL